MQENTIRGLAAMPPPRLSKCRFQKHADCYSEIARLEGLLGVAHSKPESNNIISLNARAIELERLVNLQVAKTPPAAAVQREAFPGAAIIASLEAIADPTDRTEFYRANKSAIDLGYRNVPSPKFTHKRTGVAIVDEMNVLEDPRARTAFYRKNKAAIDAAWTTCNL
jgi:hypothetical protein